MSMDLAIKPLKWRDIEDDESTCYVAHTLLGEFVYGTDELGQPYFQGPLLERDCETEAEAKEAAEAYYRDMANEFLVDAFGVSLTSRWQSTETPLPPTDTKLLLAAEFAPGDWRVKIGEFSVEAKCWLVEGASWEPTLWAPIPAFPAKAGKAGGFAGLADDLVRLIEQRPGPIPDRQEVVAEMRALIAKSAGIPVKEAG
ncbi:hypothetical protein [Kaistia terrae]|uniref:DUF551 domain-containing protein n=1 Tax=Kaistia terrae TaxID=537017 RepID=A0ABW0PZ60_9HYPH|nr:hypothetical protein [Kaistia terrae]MCX5580255.1 hypothetical protein [Kaistia terrae]